MAGTNQVRAKKVGKQKGGTTPVMKQYFKAKAQYPDAFVFFRLGDFYEMFYEDAIRASEILDLTLTSRGTDANGEKIPMAGAPWHSAASYISKLLSKGHKVALCEQMADPAECKGVVPREVVRVITPGLCLESESLDSKSSNYLVAITKQENVWGVAFLELSVGELRVCELSNEATLWSEVGKILPKEVLLDTESESQKESLIHFVPNALIQIRRVDLNENQSSQSHEPWLEDVFSEEARKKFDSLSSVCQNAVLLALDYAKKNQVDYPLRIHRLSIYNPSDQLILDEAAVRNLELLQTTRGEKKGSLFELLDQTETAMGSRMLKQRILSPSVKLKTIQERHDQVDVLVRELSLREKLRDQLRMVGDLERLTTRVSLGLANPKDLGAIRDGLGAVQAIVHLFQSSPSMGSATIIQNMVPKDLCEDVHDLLQSELLDEPPVNSHNGSIFREGVDKTLDEYRRLSSHSKDILLKMEEQERISTGIGSLKIKYNKVFGYYIEVTKSNLSLVPDRYQRKQTLTNGERYITEELFELQEKILEADEKSKAIEADRFEQLRIKISKQAVRLHQLAHAIAKIDVAQSFASVSHFHNFVRPQIDEGTTVLIEEGRHPVVEQLAASGNFVPNDVFLDTKTERFMLITGPNMSGKSTVMRQVALIVIMAQAGGFVPASRAQLGLIDRVFTRVGASDSLSEGQSTFMVEMNEAAFILESATHRSLVVLDEIGRGTSTYDGLSIAWSIAEYLHDKIGCKVMFATHYHELCALESQKSGIVNYNVSAKEKGDQMVFLHRLEKGGASRSYGIAVARLAGLPSPVIQRANELLKSLEKGGQKSSNQKALANEAIDENQMGLFESSEKNPQLPSEIEQELKSLDLNTMTPIEAFSKLASLKKKLEEVE